MNSFVLADPDKCIGCHTCEAACAVAHSDQDFFRQTPEETEFYPRLTVVKTGNITAPVQCRHCEDAPCANVCPNGSITSSGDGICINQDTCIGCKTCMLACPYGAIEMVPLFRDGEKQLQAGLRFNAYGTWIPKEKIVASKCDLCEGNSGGPACVNVCPTNALQLIVPARVQESVAGKRTATAQALLLFGGAAR
ncbi:4Fe-4S dicluster domain-containing protein [Paenibacillus macerans]|uniref:4Fe-4S dicluster domain-containing protein n=1 Tax=Paenibacillus macerans TaxID=44252 RepID=UPI0020411BDB|nr:4Fe-4S dicluster domain-containing protein [Paenibacillus macerans]MCM3703005.1 4Fe-4S dicluster domain-containing protein [Paenibacillus macerans]